jgi:hypothetical protein
MPKRGYKAFDLHNPKFNSAKNYRDKLLNLSQANKPIKLNKELDEIKYGTPALRKFLNINKINQQKKLPLKKQQNNVNNNNINTGKSKSNSAVNNNKDDNSSVEVISLSRSRKNNNNFNNSQQLNNDQHENKDNTKPSDNNSDIADNHKKSAKNPLLSYSSSMREGESFKAYSARITAEKRIKLLSNASKLNQSIANKRKQYLNEKKKNSSSEEQYKDFLRYDKFRYGEVAERPPTISIKPKLKKSSKLPLQSMSTAEVLKARLAARELELQRNQAIAAYQQLKNKRKLAESNSETEGKKSRAG